MGVKIQNIAVTGGSGFIGSHLVDNLLSKDYHVTVFDRHYEKTKFQEYGWENKVEFRLGDLKDRDAVFELVSHCDAVINLAGLLGTQEMMENPSEAINVNILGAINIFDAVRLHNKRGFQIAVGNHWMLNPYSITKNTTEKFALMYNDEHQTDIRVVRAMNAYGERQLHKPIRKIFPNIVIPALLNKDITIYGSGNQVMDLVYVKDVVEIIARATIMPDVSNNILYEAGVGEMTINQAVEMILEITNSTSKVNHIEMRPGEEEEAIVKISEQGWKDLTTHLQFTKEDLTPMQQAFKQTIEWYKARLNKFNWDK